MRALLIPVNEPVKEIDLKEGQDQLAQLQAIVGGYIESFYTGNIISGTVAFINEEGKLRGLEPNPAATELAAPNLQTSDYIAGTMVIVGKADENGDITELSKSTCDNLIRNLNEPYESDYSYNPPLKKYKCTECKKSGIKLWREYQTFSPRLLCAVCAAKDQGKDISTLNAEGLYRGNYGEFTDQIGWYVPAIPDEERVGYWGYASVPERALKWWSALPNG